MGVKKIRYFKVTNLWRSCLLLSLCLFFLSSCALFGLQPSARYDDRTFTLLNLNLFNQRIPSSLAQKHWKGDWLFRRERLEFIDEQLKVVRPDVVVFQQLLTRRGSPSESDINILSHGALEGYEWDADAVAEYKDTQEIEYQASAVGLPVKLANGDMLEKRYWNIGLDGYMSYSLLELDQKPFLLVNLTMPSSSQRVDQWYKFVRDEIRRLLFAFNLCPSRLIVSGYIPGGLVWEGYTELLSEFDLKDTSQGFCEAALDCLTTSQQNDIFMATAQGQSPSHSDRTLVHRGAIITASNVVLREMRTKLVNGEDYGISRLWAARSFGWLSSIRLQECLSSLKD
jgi:hypothetical protein